MNHLAHTSHSSEVDLSAESMASSLRRLAETISPMLWRSEKEVREGLTDLSPEELATTQAAFGRLTEALTTLNPLLSKPPVIVEELRSPTKYEPTKLNPERLVYFLKESKLEFDMRQRCLDADHTINEYRAEGLSEQDINRIVTADAHHSESVRALRALLPQARVEVISLIDDEKILQSLAGSDWVVAVGGDDTFKLVASYLSDQFVIPLNSDPESSKGALCTYTAESFAAALPALLEGKFTIQEWARLDTSIVVAERGRQRVVHLRPAISEVVVAEHSAFHTTRGILHFDEQDFRLKGSGIVVATGCGSTGWLAAARKHIYPGGRPWAKTDRRIEFGQMMAYVGDGEQIEAGELVSGKPLTITSSGNREPLISGDSVTFEPFPRGSVATIQLSDRPLKVVTV